MSFDTIGYPIGNSHLNDWLIVELLSQMEANHILQEISLFLRDGILDFPVKKVIIQFAKFFVCKANGHNVKSILSYLNYQVSTLGESH